VTVAEILMLIAVLYAPLGAVQASQWLERRRRAEDRRLAIFQTLMATRTQRLSAAHVNALNMIDVEFYESNQIIGGKRFVEVTRAWHAYLDNLGLSGSDVVFADRERLFIELLYVMAQALQYDFDRTTIKRIAYAPVAHSNLERDQETIRSGVIALLSGKSPISVQVLPPTDSLALPPPDNTGH
jgi:hypothetical protein